MKLLQPTPLIVAIVSCAFFVTNAQVFPAGEWQTASPASQGVDPQKLEEAIRFLEQNAGSDGAKELVIIRNGYLIWQGENIDKVHGVWSLTKSFTSTALGLLMNDGKCTLETLAKDYLPSLTEHYEDVTLKHFTTMTSGYRAKGDEPQGDYQHGPSRTPFTPSPTPLFPPGSQFAYWDSAMNQFANILTRIAGEPLDSLFQRRIAGPIGMDTAAWHWGDFGEVDGLRVNSGAGNHVRMNISARALARFGYLFLNKGHWNGEQLLSTSWIEQATSVQVPATLPLGGYVDQGPGTYGFNWWVNGTGPDGQRKWPQAPASTYAASGYNNNDMFVISEWNMVVVRLGLDQPDQLITDEVYSTFLGKIGEALY